MYFILQRIICGFEPQCITYGMYSSISLAEKAAGLKDEPVSHLWKTVSSNKMYVYNTGEKDEYWRIIEVECNKAIQYGKPSDALIISPV